jgi:hypothetical protein
VCLDVRVRVCVGMRGRRRRGRGREREHGCRCSRHRRRCGCQRRIHTARRHQRHVDRRASGGLGRLDVHLVEILLRASATVMPYHTTHTHAPAASAAPPSLTVADWARRPSLITPLRPDHTHHQQRAAQTRYDLPCPVDYNENHYTHTCDTKRDLPVHWQRLLKRCDVESKALQTRSRAPIIPTRHTRAHSSHLSRRTLTRFGTKYHLGKKDAKREHVGRLVILCRSRHECATTDSALRFYIETHHRFRRHPLISTTSTTITHARTHARTR